MPTLLERSADLSAKLEQIANKRVNQQRYSQMTPVLDGLHKIAEDLSSKSQSRALFVAHHVPVATVDVNTASDKLGDLKTKLEDSPDMIAQGNQWARAQTALEGLSKSLDTAIKTAWKEFVDGNTPGIELLQPYAGLADFRPVFQKLEVLKQEATASKQTLPTGKEAFKRVTDRKEEMETAIKKFGLEGEPEDCQNLLKRCATAEGVPLGELTFDQLKWLIDKGFAKSLRIKSN
jgi:hypothetical protein